MPTISRFWSEDQKSRPRFARQQVTGISRCGGAQNKTTREIHSVNVEKLILRFISKHNINTTWYLAANCPLPDDRSDHDTVHILQHALANAGTTMLMITSYPW